MFRMTFAASALTLWIPTVCMAGTDTLTIGDKAPAIDVAHWLKGDALEEFERGKIYVLEFWATWCAPCKASIPHITELQEQYRDYDVTFVGISDEKLQTVVKFLCKKDSSDQLWNDKIQYTLATDADGSVHNAYMRPAAQDTIPKAFIIGKDHRIEWIGGPMEIDDVLADVLRDRWDRDAFGAEFEKRVAPVREAMRLMDAMDSAAESGDWEAAQVALGKLIESQPGYEYLKTRLFRKMIHHADPDQAYAYGRTVMRDNWDDASILNQLAWFTVDDEGVEKRDLVFAREAARRSNELTNESNAGILDTVARVYFEMGDLESAIMWQRKAAKHAEGSAYEDSIQETLEKYERLEESRL